MNLLMFVCVMAGFVALLQTCLGGGDADHE